MVVYLLTPAAGDSSLVLWRLFQEKGGVVSTVYQLDFDIDNEEAKARDIKHTAETAFFKLKTQTLSDLLPMMNVHANDPEAE